MPATGDQDDLDSSLICPAQGLEIYFRNSKLGVEQGAVNIDGKKTDGKSHYVNSSRRQALDVGCRASGVGVYEGILAIWPSLTAQSLERRAAVCYISHIAWGISIHFYFPGTSSFRESLSSISFAAARTLIGSGSFLSEAGWARLSISLSRCCRMRGCCGNHSKSSHAGAGYVSSMPSFLTIRRLETWKNLLTFIWKKGSTRVRANITTRRSPRALIRPIPFIGAVSPRSSWATFRLQSATWSVS